MHKMDQCLADLKHLFLQVSTLHFHNYANYWFLHMPHMFHKPTVEILEVELSSELANTRSSRIRNGSTDINIFMQVIKNTP